MDLSELLAFAVKNGASDIHISAGLPPLIRIDGDIRRIKVDPLPSNVVHDMIYDIISSSITTTYGLGRDTGKIHKMQKEY